MTPAAAIRALRAMVLFSVFVVGPLIIYLLSIMDAPARKAALWLIAVECAGQLYFIWVTERWHARRKRGSNA